jgi:RNA polymerase sigma-70 factor (ECF subfamily)
MALRSEDVSAPDLGPTELQALVRRAQAGDRDAFGEIFMELHPRILRLARVRLRGAAADDAAAETFLRAWSGLARYRQTPAPFAAWLYGIARHVIADIGRKRPDPAEHAADPVADDFAPASIARVRIAAGLASLPDEQRRVVELKFFMGLTNDEVARALGKSAGAVNAQQWRALENLRRALGEP